MFNMFYTYLIHTHTYTYACTHAYVHLICLAINTIGIKLEVMNGITLLIPEIVVVYASYKHTTVNAHMHVHVHKHAQSIQQIFTYLVKSFVH
jgi:hypothetical protein